MNLTIRLAELNDLEQVEIRKGWNKVSEEQALLPNGIAIKVVQMEKDFC